MLRMIELITQLQAIRIYTRILDKESFFKKLETDKECKVEYIHSVLKCQPFIVVDENKEALLQAENMERFFYRLNISHKELS
ncbi:hypothetical protein [Helicobacter trogontum]|uniref:Uncharacterized protein n=2 Tax=Helicobacter trogontum TaxID=50960 RepID=A0A4U8S215_9HELI|nr:hypothetical protein [Helicobacter trogontum]TLD79671.1 hypothetical protein LS81_010540 [Helicobacter trogontum]